MCVVGVATALLMFRRRVVSEAEAELRCGAWVLGDPGSVGGEAPCSGLH